MSVTETYLREVLKASRDELARHGWGDMRFGATPQEKSVVDMLALIDSALAVPEPVTPTAADVRYVLDSYMCVRAWLAWSQTDNGIGPLSYWSAIRDQAALVVRILEGQPSPWHDGAPEDYLAVMDAIGSMREFSGDKSVPAPVSTIPVTGEVGSPAGAGTANDRTQS